MRGAFAHAVEQPAHFGAACHIGRQLAELLPLKGGCNIHANQRNAVVQRRGAVLDDLVDVDDFVLGLRGT